MIELAKEHRKNPTEAEDAMWHMLRERFFGLRFRRQHIIGDYIVDFVCLQKKLIIEIDGGYHFTEEQIKEDELRTATLNSKGFSVIRFTNEEVLFDTDKVLQRIKTYIIKEML